MNRFRKVRSHCDIFIGEYPFHQELKEEWAPILESYPDCQDRLTNVKATMTEWDMLSVMDEYNFDTSKLKKLKETMLQDSYRFYESCKYRSSHTSKIGYRNFWSNIYRKGDYTKSHNHIFSNVSCVYFLKAKWYHSPLVFTQYGERIRPKEGNYVLFPSYLMHHVPKHKFNDTRITISGNIEDNDL